MIPLLVLCGTWVAVGVISGLISADWNRSWGLALRVALTTMFAFTAWSHFSRRTRSDLIRMVPPSLGAPGAWVTLTGFLEAAGAIGLLIPRLSALAATCLALLLVALFPANVHAARTGVTIAGRKVPAIGPRLALQILWIALLLWVRDARM